MKEEHVPDVKTFWLPKKHKVSFSNIVVFSVYWNVCSSEICAPYKQIKVILATLQPDTNGGKNSFVLISNKRSEPVKTGQAREVNSTS